MNERDMLIKTLEKETNITLKCLRAYPASKLGFKPHERSRSARQLAWNFVEEGSVLIAGALKGAIKFDHEKPPATLAKIIEAFEKTYKDLVKKIKAMKPDAMNSSVKFGVGSPHEMDMRRGDAMWLAIMDQVHHRGQFSVYIRMAGGKVPSIYGPSADDPGM